MEDSLFVPARSAPTLPTELLRCSYSSDKWSKKRGQQSSGLRSFLLPTPLFIIAVMSPLFPDIHLCLCDLHTQREGKPRANKQGRSRDSVCREGLEDPLPSFPLAKAIWEHSAVPVKMLKVEESRSVQERGALYTKQHSQKNDWRHMDVSWAWTIFHFSGSGLRA